MKGKRAKKLDATRHGSAKNRSTKNSSAKNSDRTQNNNFLRVPIVDDHNHFNVIVETPRNSRNKFKYDERTGLFECLNPLPRGMVFPFDFGFIPSTRCDDGDPIDVLVLMDEPSYPGTLVRVLLIGVLEAEQKEAGETVRNDRLLAVHLKSSEFGHMRSWKEVPKEICRQVEAFFGSYTKVRGKDFRSLGWRSATTAKKLVQRASIG